MSTAKKLLLGSASRSALSVVHIVIGFFMMPFLVHQLGDKWYGIWTMLGSIVAYFQLFDMGFASAVQRYVAKYIAVSDDKGANEVINTALVIYSMLSALVLLFTLVLVLFVDVFVDSVEDMELIAIVFFILGLNLALEFPFKSFAGIVAAYVRYELLSCSRFFILIFSTGFIVYFVKAGHGILALAGISLVSSIISNIIYYGIAKYCFSNLKVDLRMYQRSQVKELYEYSIWSFLSTISTHLKLRLDSVVIAYFLGPVYVTHYFIGARLSEYFRTLVFQATNVVMPVLTKYHALNRYDELRKKVILLTKLSVVIATLIGGMLVIVGDSFISLWMGDEYDDAFPVLILLVVAAVIEMALNPARSTLFAIAKHRFAGITDLGEAVTNVIFSVALVSAYGIFGVALGTLIPLLCVKLVILPPYISRQLQMPYHQYYISLILPFLFVSIYLLAYWYFLANRFLEQSYINIILIGLIGCPLAAVGAYLLLFTKEEKTMLMQILPFKYGGGVRG